MSDVKQFLKDGCCGLALAAAVSVFLIWGPMALGGLIGHWTGFGAVQGAFAGLIVSLFCSDYSTVAATAVRRIRRERKATWDVACWTRRPMAPGRGWHAAGRPSSGRPMKRNGGTRRTQGKETADVDSTVISWST